MMLTFEQKQKVIEEFPNLTKKEVSLKRLNYHLDESIYDKTVVVQHLHPNGNGFVYVGDLPGYEPDSRGLHNIRLATEEELTQAIADSIRLLTTPYEPVEEVWVDERGNELVLLEELDAWNIYFEEQLEDSFGDYQEALDYLAEQQCTKKE